MSEHRYILQPYKGMTSRYHCPECRQKGKFARYFDTAENKQLGDNVGKCERSDKCGYHYTPKRYFADNGIVPDHNTDVLATREVIPERPTSLIDPILFSKSLTNYDENYFVIYLKTLFDDATVNCLIDKFRIGTSRHWPGSTIFWQSDVAGNIRTGKIMQYDGITGKRIKVPFEKIQWVHKVTKAVDFNLKQCLFGEHQLSGNKLPIAVVESEKTAIIASGYLPQLTWVASGNKQGLSVDKCNALKKNNNGKPVILYPDLNAYKEWEEKAKLYNFKISDLLEKKATPEEKENGLDLADYLIRFKVSEFVTPMPATITPLTPQAIELPKPIIIDSLTEETPNHFEGLGGLMYENGKIKTPEAKQWRIPSFEGLIIPETLRLDAGSFINDVHLCIQSHLEIVNANNGNNAYQPYLSRLKQIHSLIN